MNEATVAKLLAFAHQDASPNERDVARHMLTTMGLWPPKPKAAAFGVEDDTIVDAFRRAQQDMGGVANEFVWTVETNTSVTPGRIHYGSSSVRPGGGRAIRGLFGTAIPPQGSGTTNGATMRVGVRREG